ncbi:MAG: hypothetical protein XXXJIFNMEKO3_00138 [Candidatus Erwinia impunctatus]|nr:hypothetical protein XXXJIFNMEKO_00138 [Culicoides impunctatus]
MTDSVWFLYILQTANGLLYTGITTDVPRRVLQHQQGKGAKALRGKGPLTLRFHCTGGDRAAASRLEYHVKQLDRAKKLRLIEEQPAVIAEWLTTLYESRSLRGGAKAIRPDCPSNAVSEKA